jgi:demethylmenaquinone methyltransferase/2-methoxy-6-polyprenyl-1,4-benzoquinol methylase
MTLTPPRLTLPGGSAKRSYVREMFTAIAPRYDLLNHVLSLNVDRLWRRRAVERLEWQRAPRGVYLDLCAGTLDLAATLARRPGFRGTVIGADFVVPMLRIGRRKSERLRVVGADALALPFPDGCFDGLLIAFGIRNLMDHGQGLSEMARVLRAGGRLSILEFSLPRVRAFRLAYQFYFRRVLPTVGRLLSRHPTAYSYLPDSVQAFPAPEGLVGAIGRAGFREVRHGPLTLGIAALYTATRA